MARRNAMNLSIPASRVLRSSPPAVPTSTVIVYFVFGSRSSITTLESVVLTALTARTTLPTCEEGWFVTKYTGNPLAWRRVSGVQLTRAALLLFTLSTCTLLTWAMGAGWKVKTECRIIRLTSGQTTYSFWQLFNHLVLAVYFGDFRGYITLLSSMLEMLSFNAPHMFIVLDTQWSWLPILVHHNWVHGYATPHPTGNMVMADGEFTLWV